MAEKVLVVDDDTSFRKAISRLLKAEGYDVVSVADGIEAMARCSDAVFDLVLSDFAMPGMDGCALARERRTVAPRTPIIIMSGHPDVKRVNVIGAGAVDFIEKPILLDPLLAKIGLALRPEHRTSRV
jgi:DNA-binding NtrC family response regulator